MKAYFSGRVNNILLPQDRRGVLLNHRSAQPNDAQLRCPVIHPCAISPARAAEDTEIGNKYKDESECK